MNLTRQIILVGASGAFITLLILLFRQRTFPDTKGLSLILGGFLFAANFPMSVFVCIFAFAPDEPISKTKLAGYEWYLFFAGMASFLFGLDSLVKVFRQAYKVEQERKAK